MGKWEITLEIFCSTKSGPVHVGLFRDGTLVKIISGMHQPKAHQEKELSMPLHRFAHRVFTTQVEPITSVEIIFPHIYPSITCGSNPFTGSLLYTPEKNRKNYCLTKLMADIEIGERNITLINGKNQTRSNSGLIMTRDRNNSKDGKPEIHFSLLKFFIHNLFPISYS